MYRLILIIKIYKNKKWDSFLIECWNFILILIKLSRLKLNQSLLLFKFKQKYVPWTVVPGVTGVDFVVGTYGTVVASDEKLSIYEYILWKYKSILIKSIKCYGELKYVTFQAW